MLHATESSTDIIDGIATLPKLGVGLSFQGTLRDYVRTHSYTFDFVEIIPDAFWNDVGTGEKSRYQVSEDAYHFLAELCTTKPIIAHSIGLSIGSAEQFDTEHVAQIAAWQQRYQFPWHSDHLSFNKLDDESGHAMNVGFTMPIPYDEEALAMLIKRVNYVQQTIPVPFVLENNVYYFSIPEQDMSEAEFLNRLSAATKCGLLIDLHNVYTNAQNHKFDPWEFLGDIDLTRVVEIHIGGGMIVDEFYMDAHSGPGPDEVWALLEAILSAAPNVAGIVFEVFGTHYPLMGPESLKGELDRARAIWERYR